LFLVHDSYFLCMVLIFLLSEEKYNDYNYSGALADLNQAIDLNPEDGYAYLNRAILRGSRLGDQAGSIPDLRRAAQLFRQQGQTQYLQTTLQYLKFVGAEEQ
jgi:tetratricopeptide (TPR) repeat protein